jgi:hypothetical protein
MTKKTYIAKNPQAPPGSYPAKAIGRPKGRWEYAAKGVYLK